MIIPIKNYRKNFRKFLKKKIKKIVNFISFKQKVSRINRQYQKKIKSLKNKKKIKIAFFVIHEDVFSLKNLYELFNENTLFECKIVVIPYILQSKNSQIESYLKTLNFFKKNKYDVINCFNKENNNFDSLRYNPDIIFFTNPHNITEEKFLINNFKNIVRYYIPYSYNVSNLYHSNYGQNFFLEVDKVFCETIFHYKDAVKTNIFNKSKFVILGHPKGDLEKYQKNKNLKRTIIWSPHHSVIENKDSINYSTFLIYSDLMLKIFFLYKEKINFIFKPHPILFNSLEKVWSSKKIENFIKKINELDNVFYEKNDYKDAFVKSDAIINDSGSFVAEYLFQNKPSLFLYKGQNITNEFSDFGKMALKQSYAAFKEEDIINFIENVVLKNNDPKKEEREKFVEKYMTPPNGKTASENIYDYIIKEIGL